jgi:hypothetical protein
VSQPEFARFLTLAVLAFAAGLPLTQWALVREMRRRARDPALLEAFSVRDHVLRSLPRSARPGLILAAGVFAVWLGIHRPLERWTWILGAEMLLAFLVLQVGLAVFTIRFLLRVAADDGTPPRTLVVRLAVIAAGWLYGLVVWMLQPGSPWETLFAVLLLGVGVGVLGLNRTADATRDAMRRLDRR